MSSESVEKLTWSKVQEMENPSIFSNGGKPNLSLCHNLVMHTMSYGLV